MLQTTVIPAMLAAATALNEFKIPCVQGCGRDATWAVRSSHGLACPQDGAVCDHCKAYLVASWADTLRRGSSCANCHTTAVGELTDHLRFLRL